MLYDPYHGMIEKVFKIEGSRAQISILFLSFALISCSTKLKFVCAIQRIRKEISITNYRTAVVALISTVLLISTVEFNASGTFAPGDSEDRPTVTSTSTLKSNHQIFPRTLFLDPSLLVEAKKGVKNDNSSILHEALTHVLFNANEFLTKKPTSVVDKTQLPPSGNKHDFLSQTPYRWRNPNTPNGLPYIFRDGENNPEANSIPDKRNMDDMVYTVKLLSLAYYFTDNNQYASKAAELLRVWFLNMETRMNPNLNYSETIPGNHKANPSGIMAGSYLTNLLDAIGLIQNSPSWTKEDQHEMELWFSEYLNWLLNSDVAKEEAQKINNHGTYYDVQVSSIALFLNKTDIAENVLKSTMHELTPATLASTPKVMAVRIQPDGRQPFELERSNSLDYSMFNLIGLFKLASIGQHIGIDLWHYKTHEGAGLQKALDYLVPYALKNKSWPYQQNKRIWTEDLADLLCQATIHYPDNPAYTQAYGLMNRTDIRMNIDYAICLAPNVVKQTELGMGSSAD